MSIATEIARLQSAKSDIKSAIEQKGVEVGNGTIDTYAEKVRKISVGGGSEYINSVALYDFRTFEGESIEINGDGVRSYGLTFTVRGEDGFCKGNTTLKSVTAMFPNAIGGRHAFSGCSNLEYVKVDTSKFSDNGDYTAFNSMFYGCAKLKRIEGFVNGSNAQIGADGMFAECSVLEYVAFVPLSIKISPNLVDLIALSNEGIQCAIDGLADLTGGTTQTITFHKDVGAKLTEEQKATITAKNWTLAY